MERFALCIAVLAAMAQADTVWAGRNTEESPLRLDLELADGSLIIGSPDIMTIRLETSFGKIDLPLARISNLKLGDDHATASLNLDNGDKLQGVIKLDLIKLETIFGKVAVGIENIKELRVVPVGAVLPETLKQGLVVHYSFDRDEGCQVSDLSGKANHGTVAGAKHTPEGKHGGAYSLSGSNEHITIPNSDSLEIRGNLTLAVWIKLTTLGPGGYGNEHGYIINKGDDLWWNPAFCLGYSKEGEPLFHVCNATDPQSGGGKSATGANKLEPGTWYHLAGVYDGATVKLYVNGRLEKSAAYTGPLRADRAPVHLGGGKLFGVDWGNHFTVNGIVDEVMIHDRALTEREIYQLHNSRK